jgi:O-antigen ligase
MAIAVVLGLIVFFSARLVHKLKLLIVGVVLAIVVIVATPQTALQRYRTIFSDKGKQEAVQSREARLELLKASLRITAKHPIFGVGLGNFVVAYNDERSDAGLVGHWEATHNAYTQMSADTGIPSLVLYLGAIFSAFVAIRKIRKETKKLPAFHVAYRASSVLMVATVAYVVSGLFTSNAHEFYLPALLGLSVAVSRAATRELAAYRALQQGAAPAVAEPSRFAAAFRPRKQPFGRETALTRNN